jgi:solute carrier family 38 (sodium-coupled neutral amino acid transporter), member 11
MISYNVVVGDTLSKVLVRFVPSWGASMGAVRFAVVFVVTLFVTTPLCLYKNVSRLARASFLSLACVVLILFCVMYKFISGDYDVV